MFLKILIFITGFIAALLLLKKKLFIKDDDDNNMKSVVFKLRSETAKTVSIVGDFNNWNINSDPMFELGNNIFNINLYLKPGTYHYKYIIDNSEWVIDPNAEQIISDTNEKQSVVVVN